MSGHPRQEEPTPGETSNPDQPPSDYSLLRRVRSGDEEAAAYLYHKYADRLCAFVKARTSSALASRLDAEDIVQSVFRSFFRVAGTGVYHVPDGGDLWKLLLTIALNKVRAQGVFHRAAKRDVGATTSLSQRDPGDASLGKEDLEDAFLQMALDDVLGRLSATERAAVELRLQGYEVDAIAQRVGRSKRTVERSLQRALRRLEALFEKD